MATLPPPTLGARGTNALADESKPPFGKSRKRRGRAQPYRKRRQQPGMTLDAMLKGAPAYLPNPMDLTRKMRKRQP